MDRMIACSRCQGTFLLVHSTWALEDVVGEMFPGEIISHDFQCTGCGRGFQLYADTYHGNVSWRPLE